METDQELDQVEAAEAKELAIRLALGLLFAGLAYLGVAGALEHTRTSTLAPESAEITR